MTRNLFIVFPSIHQAAISSSLSSELFYTILEGLNPINPNRRLTAKCFLHPDCTSFLQFPRQPRIHLFGWWVAGAEAHWAISLEHQGLACGPQQSSPLCLSWGLPRNQWFHRENKNNSSNWGCYVLGRRQGILQQWAILSLFCRYSESHTNSAIAVTPTWQTPPPQGPGSSMWSSIPPSPWSLPVRKKCSLVSSF